MEDGRWEMENSITYNYLRMNGATNGYEIKVSSIELKKKREYTIEQIGITRCISNWFSLILTFL